MKIVFKQQSAILDCLKLQEKEYVTVTDIEKYLKDKGCAVGLTTIYRHLDKMEKDGIVARINVEKQQGACYQYVEDGKIRIASILNVRSVDRLRRCHVIIWQSYIIM